MIDIVRRLIIRDLRAFAREVEMFPDDESIWKTLPGVTNSAGNLALHACGNLRHYVGYRLGGIAYTRNREREFAARSGNRRELVHEIGVTIAAVENTFATMSPEALVRPYPEKIYGETLRTDVFLLHLATHLAFHLGQAGYLRRVVTGENASSGLMSPKGFGDTR